MFHYGDYEYLPHLMFSLRLLTDTRFQSSAQIDNEQCVHWEICLEIGFISYEFPN